MNLLELCLTGKYDTDKYLGAYQHHDYVEAFYGKTFEPRRESTKRMLEIGIWKGGSLKLWHDYFVNATIYGFDQRFICPHLAEAPYNQRIKQTLTDAYNADFIKTIPAGTFDIIIDDGPHTLVSQMAFVMLYLDKLKEGGIAIIEDVRIDHPIEMRPTIPAGWNCEQIECRGAADSRLLVFTRA